MNSSCEQQSNTVQWLPTCLNYTYTLLGHKSRFPKSTAPWASDWDIRLAGWGNSTTCRTKISFIREEQYTQLHKERATGKRIVSNSCNIKKTRGNSCFFSILMPWPWNLTVVSALPLEEHPWFPWLPSGSGKSCWISWRPKSQSLPMGPTPVGRPSTHLWKQRRRSANNNRSFLKEEDLLKPFITISELQQLDKCIGTMWLEDG